MNKLNKLAHKDAFAFARAEMFFGEGAGTRRKLIDAAVAHKINTVPGYHEAFSKAYQKQNFADHAIAAAKERKNIDRAAKLGKNVRAMARGDHRGLSTTLIVVGVGWTIAKQTGYDKVIIAEAKSAGKKVKAKVSDIRAKYTVVSN